MNEIQIIDNYLGSSSDLLTRCMQSLSFKQSVWQAGQAMANALNQGKKIMACGNGGSMSDAMHFCAELIGRYKNTRIPLPAIALSDAGAISCIGNDFGYDQVFRRQVVGLGQPGDILLAITTSGKSDNVLRAIVAARQRGVGIIALTGERGVDKIHLDASEMPEFQIRVPSTETGMIQQIHIMVIHILVEIIEHTLGTQMTAWRLNNNPA